MSDRTVRKAYVPKSPEEWRSLKGAYVEGISDNVRTALSDGHFELSSDGRSQVERLLMALQRAVEQAEVVRSVDLSTCKARAPLRLAVNAR